MKRILFVDNSKPIRLLLHNLLKKDYEVYSVSDCSEAFLHIFEIEMPDLIIIDPSENELQKSNDRQFIHFVRNSVLFNHIQIILLTKDITRP